MPEYCVGASVTVVFVGLLLVAEVRASQTLRWLAKPIASLGFIAAALGAGWPGDGFGVAILVALVLSLAGDVLLIPKAKGAFLAGLGSFLAGHLGFAAAFLIRGVAPLWAAAALVPLAATAVGVHRWLRPHVPERMRTPVIAYIAVITTMVALAVSTCAARPDRAGVLLLVAAVGFFISDLAVARNKFVAPGWQNRMWGLPLYYGAQLVFAYVVLLPR